MKTLYIFLFIPALLLSNLASGQDSSWTRTYSLQGYNQLDLRNSAANGITVHRLLHDGFRNGIKPHMGKKTGDVVYGFYSFAATYLSMVWSHEFGHSLRAKQVGGNFHIHNADLPIAYTTMHLPDDVSYEDEALSVTGGFEVNHLAVRQLQNEFINQNGTFNEDLALSFANRMMYTIYTSLIIPIDPKEKDVWINTAGDPVHCVLPVFKNYSNDQVFLADSTVNPELVKFYNQSMAFGAFFQLLDPQFYREFGATFGSADKTRRPIFIIGDHMNGWTYGTLFNVSPLGYELYLNNYLHLKGEQFVAYFKYGNPFKNNGLGIQWTQFLNSDKFKMSALLEAWDQDIFGKGISLETNSSLKLGAKFGLNASLGYKTEGYVMGKQLDEGLNFGLGLSYLANY